VGTGFTTTSLSALHRHFQKYRTAQCPFANLPAERPGRWSGGLTSAEMRRCTWLKPRLVCEVKFHEWTRDGNLRQPVFLGLREDKEPGDVLRER
jgi:bifunctional non-homologous end joining protein LigD